MGDVSFSASLTEPKASIVSSIGTSSDSTALSIHHHEPVHQRRPSPRASCSSESSSSTVTDSDHQMVDRGVGVRTKHTLALREIDEDYFAADQPAAHHRQSDSPDSPSSTAVDRT